MNDFQIPPRLTASDYRHMARRALRGSWGIAILVTLVFSILASGGFRIFQLLSSYLDAVPHYKLDEVMQSPLYHAAVWTGGVLCAVTFVIGGPIKVGYSRFCLKLADGDRAEFKDLFSGFEVFGSAFLLQLRIALRVLGWMLLFIIPGFIALFRYAQAYYIMADNPGMKSGECIAQSVDLMDGNKGDLFVLGLTFIGWAFLCAFTCGVGFLWLIPYMNIANTVFYRDISGTSVQ